MSIYGSETALDLYNKAEQVCFEIIWREIGKISFGGNYETIKDGETALFWQSLAGNMKILKMAIGGKFEIRKLWKFSIGNLEF